MAHEEKAFEDFFRAYVETALWSSTDESTPSGGYPLDKNYGPEDITRATMQKMRRDAKKFWMENWSTIMSSGRRDAARHAGHDFWLNRNGHGAGFWDGDWPEPHATMLDDASTRFGEFHLLVSRGKIHSYQ